jgi:hypothetical protein
VTAASDEELVGQFLAGGEQIRRGWRISDIRVAESRRSQFAGQEVTVTYRLESPAGSSTQKRELSVEQSGNCWLVAVPLEAWVRLSQLSKLLKESRQQADFPRKGPARVSMQVVAASGTAGPGLKRLPRSDASAAVWVETKALLTDKDVIGAHAAWDCEAAGLGPEDPAVRMTFSPEGAKALRRWTESNMGAMLAVVVDARVVSLARVAAVLGSKLSICLPGATLEQAQALAEDLMGLPR